MVSQMIDGLAAILTYSTPLYAVACVTISGQAMHE